MPCHQRKFPDLRYIIDLFATSRVYAYALHPEYILPSPMLIYMRFPDAASSSLTGSVLCAVLLDLLMHRMSLENTSIKSQLSEQE